MVLTALPLLGFLLVGLGASSAAAQPQPSPFGQPQPQPSPFGQPQPGAAPAAQPAPGAAAPAAGAPAGQAQPGAAAGAAGGAAPPNAFGQPPADAAAQPTVGADASLSAGVDASGNAAAPSATDAEWEAEERALSLMEQNNQQGTTGLVRSTYAGSGVKGTFRVGASFDWFKASGWLCNPGKPAGTTGQTTACSPGGSADQASHVGGNISLSATPLSWLEAYAAVRTYANSDDQGRPALLQVLGDTTLGVKAFYPPKIGQVLSYGGDIQVLLLNGTGDVGLAGGGTSARFRALATADFRKPQDKGAPVRINLNLGYHLDNSGKLVESVEQRRGAVLGLVNDSHDPTIPRQPITRIERFGLGINRVDFLETNLAIEVPLSKVQPFVEWSVDVPVNARTGYLCHSSRVSYGDSCLALSNFLAPNPTTAGGPGFAAVPSRLTLGVKTNPLPWGSWRGLSAMLAFDIGLTGTSTFIEEVAPTPPWTLFFGLGYAVDTKPPAPVIQTIVGPAAPPQLIPAPQTFVRGLVHETGKADAVVANAIVAFGGNVQPPVATGADGRFLTRHVEPGSYSFNITAPGYKPGTCTATVTSSASAPPASGSPTGAASGSVSATGALAPWSATGTATAQPSPFGQPAAPSAPGAPGAPASAPPPAAPPVVPSGPTYVDIDCAVEALPKAGNVVGSVKDGETGAGVAGATVKGVDAAGKAISATADGSGNFTIKDLPPGTVQLKLDAAGYFGHGESLEVKANADNRVSVSLNKRPKAALVKVQGNEIKIQKQVHFETDSATIHMDSSALLEEIAEVLIKTPSIKRVEIQGHTDNTGGKEHNLQLSQSRAESVKKWLVKAGVEDSRLTAKGYGQERPIAPNVTAANKAKNRRVQLMILDK